MLRQIIAGVGHQRDECGTFPLEFSEVILVNWNYKLLGDLASASRRCANAEASPAASRQLFTITFEMAKKLEKPDVSYAQVELVFAALSAACRDANLCDCKEGECDIHSCRLIRDHALSFPSSGSKQ